MNTKPTNAADPQSQPTTPTPQQTPADKQQPVPAGNSAPAEKQHPAQGTNQPHAPHPAPGKEHPAPADKQPQPAAKTDSRSERHLYPNDPGFRPAHPVPVGGVISAAAPIEYNTGRRTVQLTIRNTGDRPIQVGSHFHLFEANRYLEFDRDAAFGCHLNIPATTAIRFEPGDEKQVEAVTFSGKRRIIGFNGLVMGYTGDEDAPTYFPARLRALRAVRHAGFRISEAARPDTTAHTSDDTKK